MSTGTEQEEAREIIDTVMADSQGPYFDRDDPRHARAVAEMSKLYRIVSAPKAAVAAPSPVAAARARIDAIYGDPAHPYHDGGHPGHPAARAAMPALFAAAYPDEPPDTP